jgi:hypothetical protein
VTSIGFGGFGDGAAEEAVLMAVFGVVFLVFEDGPGAGATTGLLPNVKWAGTGPLAQGSGCLSTFGAAGGGAVLIAFIIGDGAGRLDVGEGGTE